MRTADIDDNITNAVQKFSFLQTTPLEHPYASAHAIWIDASADWQCLNNSMHHDGHNNNVSIYGHRHLESS